MKLSEIVIRIRFPIKKDSHKTFGFSGGSVAEFGSGKRVNYIRHLTLFGWYIATVNFNEYYNKTDAELADEYLSKWSECEKELRGFRLLYLGDSTGADVKRVMKEAWGVNLDEGIVE